MVGFLAHKACRTVYYHNFQVGDASLSVNTVMLDDVEVLFINEKVAFTKKYLAYHESLHFRGFLSMRATEYAGRENLFEEAMHASRRWRDLYSDARFLYSATRELQDPEKSPERFALGRELTETRLALYDRKLHLMTL